MIEVAVIEDRVHEVGVHQVGAIEVGVIEVGVHEAKSTLSRLLRAVEAVQEVVIRRGGLPVAKLVAIPSRQPRLLGEDAERYEVPDDFDAPLTDDELRAFGA